MISTLLIQRKSIWGYASNQCVTLHNDTTAIPVYMIFWCNNIQDNIRHHDPKSFYKYMHCHFNAHISYIWCINTIVRETEKGIQHFDIISIKYIVASVSKLNVSIVIQYLIPYIWLLHFDERVYIVHFGPIEMFSLSWLLKLFQRLITCFIMKFENNFNFDLEF